MRREVVVWRWFNVTKVKNPSKKEPPDSKSVCMLYDYVMDKGDLLLYKMLGYSSLIMVYTFPNYFLIRQYMLDIRIGTKTLYSEYKLTLTDEAKKAVDALLKTPFECNVGNPYKDEEGSIIYPCVSIHSAVLIPSLLYRSRKEEVREKGMWVAKVGIYYYHSDSYIEMMRNPAIWAIPSDSSTIPFNFGPLYPLWVRVVDCWVDKLLAIAKIDQQWYGTKYAEEIRDRLLRIRHFNIIDIIPLYYLKPEE